MESSPDFPEKSQANMSVAVSYCPKCGAKAEKGQRYCYSCGRDLTQPITAPTNAGTAQMPSLPKRPLGISIICVLWFLGGLINLFAGFSGLSGDLNGFGLLSSYSSDVASWASWAIPLDATIMSAVIIIGLLQFATIYGFWNRKPWSRKYAVNLLIALVLANWIEVALQLAAPSYLGIQPDFILPVFGTVMAVVYLSYLNRDYVKKYLGSE
jgi:hypothetical protein